MQKHIVDEKTGIPYTLVGDYYLPWGDLPDDESEQKPLGIWGQRDDAKFSKIRDTPLSKIEKFLNHRFFKYFAYYAFLLKRHVI